MSLFETGSRCPTRRDFLVFFSALLTLLCLIPVACQLASSSRLSSPRNIFMGLHAAYARPFRALLLVSIRTIRGPNVERCIAAAVAKKCFASRAQYEDVSMHSL